MPVLLTAAHELLARRVATRLLADGGEVRAYSDGGVHALRAAGAFVATGSPDDEGLLEAALADVHTLVHIGGGLTRPDGRGIAREAAVVARAAAGAQIQRILALSLPGARQDAHDPLRRAKAQVEATLGAVDLPTIVVRCGLIDTPGTRDLLATTGLPSDVLDAEVAPVRVEDAVELLVAFDRARSTAGTGHLVVRADGPQRMPLRTYMERVGVVGPGRGGLVGRRLPDPRVAQEVLEVLRGPWRDEDPTLVDAWQLAAITPAAPGVETH